MDNLGNKTNNPVLGLSSLRIIQSHEFLMNEKDVRGVKLMHSTCLNCCWWWADKRG